MLVAHDDAALVVEEDVIGDALVAGVAQAGVEPVHEPTALQHALDHGPTGFDSGLCIGGKLDHVATVGDVDGVVHG